MEQRRDEARIYGPYGPDRRGRYRVVVVEGSKRTAHTAPTEKKAEALKAKLASKLQGPPEITVSEAIDEYLEHCERVKGLAESSRGWYGQVLRRELPQQEQLADLTPARAEELWRALVLRPAKWNGRTEERPQSPVSLRAYLRVIRTFCGWAVAKKLLPADPFAEIIAEGKGRRGKLQLTVDEAQRYLAAALTLPGEGPLLAALPLLTGGRSGELVGARCRDVDAGGAVLWLEGKTGRRPAQIVYPEVQERLAALAADRGSWDPLWREGRSGVHLIRWVRRICVAAKVPRVCPHGLRGTFASLAQAGGGAQQIVAQSLGHSVDVLRRHYTAPGAEQAGQAHAVRARLGVLQGGRR